MFLDCSFHSKVRTNHPPGKIIVYEELMEYLCGNYGKAKVEKRTSLRWLR